MHRRHRRLLTALPIISTAAALPVLAGPALAATRPTITRVSTGSHGQQLKAMNDGLAITPNGRFVLFDSLVDIPGTPSDSIKGNLFLKDRVTGTTRQVDRALGGGQPDGNGLNGTVSADGRYVAFTSNATNLVAHDTNGTTDVFRRDMKTGVITRVSVGLSGAANSGGAFLFNSISANGNLIAFDSKASDLVAGDTNGTKDIFVRNMTTHVTKRVSVSSTGEQSEPEPAKPPTIYTKNRDSSEPMISADGSAVVFTSNASNLVPDDTNLWGDVFVHNLATGATTRVSVKSDGSQSDTGKYNTGASEPSISANGKVVAFWSIYTDLLSQPHHANDSYIHHLDTGVTELAEVTTDGSQSVHGASEPLISPSGHSVAFYSADTNVAPGDTGGGAFVRNLVTGKVRRIAVNKAGKPFDLPVAITGLANDTTVLMESAATNVVPNDTNGQTDAFVVKF
jgi:Tol biopolymer transport system component